MMILISGGNGSGKSRYAETLVAGTTGPRYYIATMVAQNEENRRRIEKHRRQRRELDFATIEEPKLVGQVCVEPEAVVLLEDASNLLAEWVFGAKGTGDRALAEIRKLRQSCRHLLVVTISGLSEDGYEGETAGYIRALNRLNRQLLEMADAAVDLKDGQPILRKGCLDVLF